jgi:hypothetical protein
MARKKAKEPAFRWTEGCESCPLASAVKTISRLVAEKDGLAEERDECERLLHRFAEALKETDRRLEKISLTTGAIQ